MRRAQDEEGMERGGCLQDHQAGEDIRQQKVLMGRESDEDIHKEGDMGMECWLCIPLKECFV